MSNPSILMVSPSQGLAAGSTQFLLLSLPAYCNDGKFRLVTTVRNVSSEPIILYALGLTGVRLQPGETAIRYGTLFEWARQTSIMRFMTPKLRQIEDLIAQGKIAVLQTPSVVLKDLSSSNKSWRWDADSDKMVMVQMTAGTCDRVIVGP